jgi:hypothetical protein
MIYVSYLFGSLPAPRDMVTFISQTIEGKPLPGEPRK